ncbi:Rho-GTPase-activating protein 8 [Elasticomyces elasticus]|nr:Rho-GTPase-activating protein 8 [Elasticomyces elasticus]KAK3642547.1 Rho-GTPase-activating protein 8 [Elasticomyces elasticus]KAK4906204.1 Rho-GTPase-activating protein 8 [Elasticomyces elasticus]KAK5758022.1 Rho-GTPase-activating protein 8 [Elasticomyces elasticus]
MSQSFANSFWSADYAAGLGVLFGKLKQGVQENEQIITVARMRADAEDVYGQKLGEIEIATNKIEGGFQRDDGASTKKAYEGVRSEMNEAARNHRKIASNIRELVVNPFSRWCDQHSARVQNSQDDLQGRIKAHDRQAETVRQYKNAYFNKCRRVEDLEEEEKLAFKDPSSVAATGVGSPKLSPASVPSIKVEEEVEEPEPIEIGDEIYQPEQIKKILTHALENLRLGEAKVAILGTYQNVTSGAEITEYIQKHMGGTSIAYAERIGQDLVNNGFLRLIGSVGSTFANSSKMNYQWRPKTFQLTGIPEKRPKLNGRMSTLASAASADGSAPGSPVIAGEVGGYLSGWNPLNNVNINETPGDKLRREAKDADERYKVSVRKLDGLRCNLEEAMVDHLKFMERCELDRLKAVKSVVLDFSGAISNVIPSLQSTVDNMMLFQETVQPAGDVRYLLENYRTGSYIPKVITYENYYNQVDEQTFGVDIEARARSDRKRVPLIITTILTFLDSRYPDLEGDEARRSIWVVDVPLAAIHHLRNQLNTGKPVPPELLEKYEIPIVAAVLKLYFLELPDSLVSSHVYEIVKTIYNTTAQSTSDAARVHIIQSTLGQLRLANIATLDALITHFTRLIELTSADDAYVANLSSVLAPCILRPKQESGLSMAERYNVRLMKDLFAHKNDIFGELKRQSSLTHTNSGTTRQARAISTDESRRREHMEERQRAIAAAQQAQAGSSRNRQPSPGPGARSSLVEGSGHRRDRSRGPETRFPISTANIQSPTAKGLMSPTTSVTSSHRDSLGVPQSPPQPRSNTSPTPDAPRTNGSLHQPPPAEEEPAETFTTKERNPPEPPSKRPSVIPSLSASITGPSDFMNPSHYYSNSIDSPSTITPTTTTNPAPAPESTKPDSAYSKYRVSNTDDVEPPSPISKSSAAAADGTPIKRDSLNRTRGYPARKGTGNLGRQSLIMGGAGGTGKRDSMDSNGYAQSPVEAPRVVDAGVQLEDKAMDFD